MADYKGFDPAALLPNLSDILKLPTQPTPVAIRSPLVDSVTSNYASEFHQRLTAWIRDFDASLDNDFEVGIRLVNFGQTVTFHLTNIGFWNPSLISFSGITNDGNPVELIQHVSQISILLQKLPRMDPSKPKRPIGFAPAEE